ncbi:small nucleolar ribonucleoprotein complex subunit utp14 [Ophiostoma piceae UAMH 11346]|uniref:Small nucleolar ribonucleoprotein complex subunit utp14 n=1 Tax=Ophiostoma piceae (strain UAMH 11346) TaxID=1262450 RepID=S3C5Y6_OPHP1|nr:small nucleolar ribonucleoprotein complex subunit utp14 [Ophiostoma piceae UAMH 11346]
MPGRQAHGRPLLANPNKKRKSGSSGGKAKGNGSASGSGGAPLSSRTSGGAPRTRQGGRVDVMALAEKQITEGRVKGVRTRDLQIERDTKRRRGDDDDDEDEDEDDDDDDQGGASKRRRPNNDSGDDSANEIHSDSEGNEWREGVGADDDDSEIDSDEAFGDSDDEMFDAFSFRGSTNKQKKPKKAKKAKKSSDEFDGFDNPSDYSDEDVGDDGGELGDDAIDLAAALDIVSSDEEEAGESSAKARKSKKSKKSKSKKQADSDSDMSDASATSPYSGSDDDSDDASSGSDDQSISGSESDDEESDDDSDGEDEDEGVFGTSDALKSIASAYAGDDSNEEDSDADMASSSANPYKFNASIGALSTKDRNLKKSLKATATSSSDKTLNVPLLPMQQDQKLRVAAAGKAHETLDRWTDTVKHNRRAEHLNFEVAGSLASTGLDTTTLTPINTQAAAQTDLERTILTIMEESGLGARAQEDARHQEKLRKQQELADNPPVLSPDELKALIGQKRRERELKSQEVARAKRIKKIKSKAYRRVHRRERQRAEQMLADSDAERDSDGNVDPEAEREAQHRQRALERMGSRHRDSKWAKKAKGTNRAAWDDDFRAGLVDMARQDEELRRRVDGAGVGGKEVTKDEDEDEDDDDSYGEESDDDKFRERTKKKLEALSSKGEEEPKGLMGIAFMRKAEEARKKANDDAVAEIMRDLNRGSDDEDGDLVLFEDEKKAAEEDAVVGRRTYGPVAGAPQTQLRTKKSKTSAATEDKEPAVASAPAVPSSGFSETSSRVTLPAKVSAPGDAGSWTVVPSKNGSKRKENKSSKLTTVSNSDSLAGVTSDGRLVIEAVVSDVLEQNAVAKERVALAKSAPAPAATTQNGNNSDTSSSGSDSEDDAGPRTSGGASVSRVDKNGHVVQFRGQNEKLLLKALGEDHAAAEFAAEKSRQAAEEAEAWEEERNLGKKKNEFMSGWGSWTGDGLSKRTIKSQEQKKAKMLGGKDGKGDKKAVEKKISSRKDAKLERVIISERRVRKTEKYLASMLPHEFETRSQYERSLRLPVGPEWSTTFAFQDATKPRVLKKQGVVLPMSKPAL